MKCPYGKRFKVPRDCHKCASWLDNKCMRSNVQSLKQIVNSKKGIHGDLGSQGARARSKKTAGLAQMFNEKKKGLEIASIESNGDIIYQSYSDDSHSKIFRMSLRKQLRFGSILMANFLQFCKCQLVNIKAQAIIFSNANFGSHFVQSYVQHNVQTKYKGSLRNRIGQKFPSSDRRTTSREVTTRP